MLLVSNKRRTRWLFPKGTVKKSETPEEAAQRETEEEAGVRGRLLAYVGATEHLEGTKVVRVDYFLVRSVEHVATQEDRDVRWCRIGEAMESITSPGLRRLLERAWPDIERIA